MKTSKRNMILIALSVSIIVCVGIIMAVVAQNKTSAATNACPTHGTSFLKYTSLGGGKHKVECSACSSNLGTENCSYTSGKCTYCKATCTHSNVTATKVNSSYHKVTCNTCGYVVDEMESHSWNSSNKCTACGATKDACTHKNTTGISLGAKSHKIVCQDCGETLTESDDHYWIGEEVNKDYHKVVCRFCGYVNIEMEAHTWNESGKCTGCDASCAHTVTQKIIEAVEVGQENLYHDVVCRNCEMIIKRERHTFVNGVCECGATQSQQTCTNHQITTGTGNGNGTHTGTCPNCNKQITESHSFVNGTCTKCGATQSGGGTGCIDGGPHNVTSGLPNYDGTHTGTCTKCGQEATVNCNLYSDFINKTATTHTEVIKCSGCYYEDRKTAEPHTGGTHSNGGKCTLCSYQYQNHSQGTTIAGYDKTATTHTAKYACTYSGCTQNYTGTAEAHTGGTHGNGGKCTVCDYQYQTHGKSGNIKEYITTMIGHTPIYKCIEQGCTENYTELEEAHTGGTHSNGGKCTVCDYQYQNHSKGTTIVGYDKTATTHTAKYACTETGCTQTYEGTAEAHNYVNGTCVCGATQSQQTCTNHQITTGTDNGNGTHTGTCPNCNKQITEPHNYVNGTCTKCGARQSQQTCTNHQITTGTDNGNGTHTGTCPNCNKQITESHNFVNGTCTKCGATQGGSETCEHDFEMKYNDTMHWEQCKKCNEVKNNKKHTFVNGKCSVCSYECKHTDTTTKKNNTYHWTECNDCGKELNKEKHSYTNGKCSCGKTEETAECTHSNKEWKYNTNQHWQECKDCGAEIEGTKAAHSYTNGKCKCGKVSAAGEEEGCTHTNREWKSNTTEHWQVCKDCGQEIEGTRAKHVNVDGKCKNCGLQEGSKSGTKIPNTGYKAVAITLPMVLILVTFGAIKMKKYKEI